MRSMCSTNTTFSTHRRADWSEVLLHWPYCIFGHIHVEPCCTRILDALECGKFQRAQKKREMCMCARVPWVRWSWAHLRLFHWQPYVHDLLAKSAWAQSLGRQPVCRKPMETSFSTSSGLATMRIVCSLFFFDSCELDTVLMASRKRSNNPRFLGPCHVVARWDLLW